MRILLLSLCLLLSPLSGFLHAGERSSIALFSRETFGPVQFELSDSDWRWLGMKRQLRIGVCSGDNPPFHIDSGPGTFEGISADYTSLISHYLAVGTDIVPCADRTDALDALNNGDIDMLVDDSEQGSPPPGYLSSIVFMPDYPALVSRETALSRPLHMSAAPRIAMLRGYLSDKWVTTQYPNATIHRYDCSQNALSSVAFGENDYFIGSLAVATFLIERNYTNRLSVTNIYRDQTNGPRFLFRQDSSELQRSVNAVLKAVSPLQQRVIYHQWSQGTGFWQLQTELHLTDREQHWLEQHRSIRVLANPLYAPFTMLNDAGQFYGISADILRLIHLRTGLEFNVTGADSFSEAFEMLKQGKGDFIAAMSYSESRDKQVLFTRPYMLPPFVLVVRDSLTAPKTLADIRMLAIPHDSMLQTWLQKNHPGIRLIETDNTSMAMQMVNDGKADGAVRDLTGASYMIDHYFHGDLKIAARLSMMPARIAFAVRRDQPELYGILDKLLASIPPRDISMIINKWQGTPDVKLDTWTIYRTQFYWLTGIFAILVLTSLVWNYYLRRQIRMRKDAQSSQQEHIHFRETLFNGTPVPVYVVDRHGNISNHNPAWKAFFKRETEDLNALPLTDTSHPLATVYPALRQMLESEDSAVPLPRRYTVNNGEEERIIVHQAVPYQDRAGKIAGLICSWQDMTDYEHLMTEISSSHERADRENRTKSTFLATMSHEIRTPISAIIGLLELVVTSKESREAESEYIRVAYESAQSLMGLIGDILDMAKIESGKLELAPEWVAFSELTSPVVRVFDGLARQKHLTLNCHIDALHPDEVYIDQIRWRQVLSNLVSNAIKFTDKGSVDVQVVSLPGSDTQIMLEMTVTDTGVGIDEADQRLIFRPYQQFEAGKKQSGTGLGLAICSQLVSLMGGTIGVHSQPGRGTRVTVRTPLTHRQQIHKPELLTEEEPDTGQTLHILVVDDHPANRMVLMRQLTRLGHRVTEAEEGEQALAFWRDGDFDLVITDCSMPVMDGLMLTRCLRLEQTTPLTILGLTANAQPEERARYLAAGMDNCLLKPLRLPQLESLLRKIPRYSPAGKIHPVTLSQLINLPALKELVQDDPELLHRLLQTTYDENLRDITQLQRLFKAQDWPALGGCLHKLSGSAQIIGAPEVDRYCRELETYCEEEPGNAAVASHLKLVVLQVEALNQAIADFITTDNVPGK